MICCVLPWITVSCGGETWRADATSDDPFAGLRNRTAVVGYEYGSCDRDEDCVPMDCGGATCAPPGERGLCRETAVGACLAEVDPGLCGCYRGRCQWARVAPVQMCAILGDEKPMNRPVDGPQPNTYHRPHFPN